MCVTPTLFMLINNSNNNVMQAALFLFSSPCSLLHHHSFSPRPSSVVHTVDLFVRGGVKCFFYLRSDDENYVFLYVSVCGWL